MNNKINNRKSNIEILRIISMIMIVAHHYYVHGGFNEVTIDNISISRVYLEILSIYGKAACGIFALITGYLGISSKATLKSQIKKSILLIFEMIIYSLFGIVVFSIFFGIESISVKDIIDSFLPIFRGNWYARNYIYFCLFIPFINAFVNSLDKKTYTSLSILLLFTWVVISFVRSNAMNVGEIGMMLIMYLFGAYTNLYIVGKCKYNNCINLYISLTFAFLLGLSVISFNYIGFKCNSSYFIERYDFFIEWNSILSFGFSYFLFLFYCKKDYYNEVVNCISSSCLGVYLIHDNDFIRKIIWLNISPNILYVENPYFHSIIKIILVFVVCIFIDILRRNTIEKLFINVLNRVYDDCYQKMSNYIKRAMINIQKLHNGIIK